ncbi:MAG: phage portal protein, partial [Alphaproteobacteria bacterium]|nr:phage portal protein [Alphaproteobacteria bacterium]
MASWINRLWRKAAPQSDRTREEEAKSFDMAPLLAMHALGPARWTNRNVIALTHEG